MIRHLVCLVAQQLNWSPNKYGISKTYSPMIIVTGKNLDYNKHLQHEFGTYIQAHTKNDPSNQMKERAIDGIHLRPNTNK